MIILKNPDNGAPIETIVDKKEYKLAVGETLAFDDHVGQVLQGIYGFLQEVKIDQNVTGKFKCPYCEYANEAKIGVYGHLKGNHKDQPPAQPETVTATMSGDQEIPQAEGKPVVSLEEQRKKEEAEFYEEAGVKAAGVTDQDKVEWYGKGLEKDNPGE